ncbi:Cse1-domain-containing protein [Gautieria morchelliformis]|nr:Cse1-domain-containing protein [Gautieria morchelliformis]
MASSIGPFVQAVWALVRDGKRPAVADDTPGHNPLEMASLYPMFEDDPLKYIRIDLSIPSVSTGGSSEGTTRRHAAADVLRTLVRAGSEADTTECISTWVSEDLQAFKADLSANWKRKDRAIYPLTAIVARGSTNFPQFLFLLQFSHGLNASRCDIDECAGVVYWFAKNVLGDLEAAPGSLHPILQVDAIRYLYTFRNQHRTATEPPSLVPEVSHATPHTTALVKGTGKW